MAGFDTLHFLLAKARRSSFWLWVLNKALGRTVPFNRQHGFELAEIEENRIVTFAGYRRSNYNHVRGIHACGIATIAEFSAGFLLMTKLNPNRYRLIMSRLEADYGYQAKEDIFSESEISLERLQDEVIEPLKSQDIVSVTMESMVRDRSGNRIAAVLTTWQIKNWKKVKTKV
ncbi:DUF4442 domain-containing protein [Desulfopila sp. IMCC35008]|uniref:DUF4442 domain-containing protein n=1 Tax=Desulfopila sp. IMCC35008 TaxID=2653858 RepID=UPI0013D7FCDC|nr:DUF4442 domain-containing protein [Desulfopila sp. IMCC35008]